MPELSQFQEASAKADMTITECAGGYIVWCADDYQIEEDQHGNEFDSYDIAPHVFTDEATMLTFIASVLYAAKTRAAGTEYPDFNSQQTQRKS